MSIPLTIVGGFLGAGKTTLINHVLQENDGTRYAILVNDFGGLAIDEDLILSHDGQTIALANGCVCCSLSSDLMQSLVDVVNLSPDQILIEASGVADPGRLKEIAFLDPALSYGGALTFVDTGAFLSQLADPLLEDTLERQLLGGDLIVLNKIDLQENRAKIHEALREIAPNTPVLETVHSVISMDLLSSLEPLTADGRRTAIAHTSQIFHTISLSANSALEVEDFRSACEDLPNGIVRIKGFVRIKGECYLVQRAGNQTTIERAERKINKPTLIIIGTRDMPSQNELADALGYY